MLADRLSNCRVRPCWELSPSATSLVVFAGRATRKPQAAVTIKPQAAVTMRYPPDSHSRSTASVRRLGGAVVLQALEALAEFAELPEAALSGGPEPQQQQPCGADGGPAGQLGGDRPHGIHAQRQ